MAEATDRRWVLRARPRGTPRPEDFELVDAPLEPLAPGRVRMRNDWLGLAPAARLRMGDEPSYVPPMAIGDTLHCQAVGTVVESRHDGFAPGDPVVAMHAGWQRWSTPDPASLYRIDPALAPPAAWLGALGSSGQTAWIGVDAIGGVRAGETVVVSAAAGAVGGLAAQIASLRGARVVGIAGGPVKCAIARDEYRCDACVDHRAGGLADALARACPDGVDVYFDNVGGAVRDAAWPLMRRDGRVVVCGLVAEYNAGSGPGPEWRSILSKRLTVRGFIMSDHAHRRDAFVAEMGAWLRDGRVRLREDPVDGLEAAPAAFLRMLEGGNLGKTLVRLR